MPGWRDWLAAALILTTTIALFSPVRRHEFVNYDDPYYVTENTHVRAGLSADSIRWAFTTFEDGNWFPLTWISHMADISLWGMDAGAHHRTSVVIHAFVAALLLLTLRLYGLSLAVSAFVAAFFAWHPLRVESVAWIAERKDVLSGLFTILALAAYARYASRPARSRYLLVLAMFALSLMSKAMAVTLPVVMLLLDFWPLRRAVRSGTSAPASWRGLLGEKIPFVLMSAAVALVALIAQRGAGATATTLSLPKRAANAGVSYALYLTDTVWPSRLAVFYPYDDPGLLPALAAAFGILVISLTAWQYRHRQPQLMTGWFWYLVMLLPVIGLLQIGAQSRADRYTYLPSIGIYLAVAATASQLVRARVSLQWVSAAAAAAALIAGAAVTRSQLAVWRTSITLFEHARSVAPSYTAANNLGEALASRGDMARAADAFAEAVAISPANASARVNLANALGQTGRVTEAAAAYREAIRLQPRYAEARAGLAVVLARQGATDEAIRELAEAVRLDPSSADAHFNLANLLASVGRHDEAIARLFDTVRLRPSDPAARSNLGALLAQQGRFDEAIAQFEEALRLDPGSAQARANLERARQLKQGKGGKP